MIKIFRIGLLLAFLFGFRNQSVTHEITIKLTVHGTDEKLTAKILSDLKTDLGNKSHVVVVSDTTDSSTFSITVQYATLKSGDKLNGFFMNSLLTRRIRTSKNETAYILLKSSVSSTSNAMDIDKICSNVVDQYDALYFEAERRKPDL